MDTVPAQCKKLLEKLSRIAIIHCNESLGTMMDSWLCFEMCCALEKSSELGEEVYLWSDLSPDIKDKLGLPQIDVGIDYIDEKCSFAGQAKFYQEESYVSAKAIDRTRLCMYRAIKNGKSKVMEEGCEIATPERVILGNSRIEMDDVKQRLVNKKRVKYWCKLALNTVYDSDSATTSKLRSCQIAAINKIEKGRINRILLACGSGKTRIASEVMARDQGRHLVLVPYLNLLEQWADYIEQSGTRVIKIGTGYSDILDKLNPDSPLVVICVYDSYERAFNSYKNKKKIRREFDWVIVDEAHHVEFRSSGRNSKIWEEIQEQNSVILMSATLDREKEDDIPLCYEYSLRNAIEDGICCDYDVRIAFFDRNPDARMIAEYIRDHSMYLSILVYCNRIESAVRIAKWCRKLGIKSANYRLRMRAILVLGWEHKKLRLEVMLVVNLLGKG